MIFDLLVMGSLWFYAAWIIPALFLIAFVEFERSGMALLTVIVTALVWTLFGDRNVWPWLAHHPIQIIVAIAAYVVVGVLWGVVRWTFLVWRARDAHKALRAEYAAREADFAKYEHDKRPQRERTFEHFFTMHIPGAERLEATKPDVVSNKGRIIFWMSYWPFSALWTIVHDPVTRFFEFLYRRLAGIFEGISNRMFREFEVKD